MTGSPNTDKVADGDTRVIAANGGEYHPERHVDEFGTHSIWLIDNNMYCKEEGKPVIFRNMKFSGHVLELEDGDHKNNTHVLLAHERVGGDGGEEQKWLLQKLD
ncbi:MAG: hypothetical protein Q9181_005649 [Wetmoreana brouardii]